MPEDVRGSESVATLESRTIAPVGTLRVCEKLELLEPTREIEDAATS
jgi:hypothetical protein